MRATVRATRAGSSGSFQVGLPVLTLQNPQRRVQVSPRIMNVAVPRCQHSPMLGHAASWQTVCRFSALIRLCSSRYLGPPGAGTLNQGGLRPRCGWTSGPSTVRTSAIPPGLALDLVALTISRVDPREGAGRGWGAYGHAGWRGWGAYGHAGWRGWGAYGHAGWRRTARTVT